METSDNVSSIIILVAGIAMALMVIIFIGAFSGTAYQVTEPLIEEIGNSTYYNESFDAVNNTLISLNYEAYEIYTIYYANGSLFPASNYYLQNNDVVVTHDTENEALVAWYKFNNNSDDEKGDYNGTVGGSITNVSGEFGGAYNFNNTYDNVSIGYISDFYDKGAVTVTAWVRRLEHTTNQAVVTQNIISSTGGFGLMIRDNERIRCYWGNNTYNETATGTYPTDGAYHFIACSYKNGGTASIFLDGVNITIDGGYNNSTGINNNSDDILIGMTKNGLYPFNGSIDNVQLYSYALSAAEVASLYALGEDDYYPMYVTYESTGSGAIKDRIKGGILSSFTALEQTADYAPIIVLAVIIALILSVVIGAGLLGKAGGNKGVGGAL